MMTTVLPRFVCAGGIFIDDIVLPDGMTQMGVLGGGVIHAAAGMQVWGQRAGLVARAGRDLPEGAYRRLERDFDLRGVDWVDLPQMRAWQLFEWDGRRSEVFRVEVTEPFINGILPSHAPTDYNAVCGVYLLRDADMLLNWRARFPHATLLWEPLQQVMLPENARAIRAALRHIDIVSPNWLEAQQVYDFEDPAQLVAALLDDGATIAALRMGEHGSLVGSRDGMLIEVPAVPVPRIIDQTGAGNTYCGGFLVGWCDTGDLREAACYAAVAASFSLESPGVADPPPDVASQRVERCDWVRERLTIR